LSTEILKDRIQKVLFSDDVLHARIRELGHEIAKEYGTARTAQARPPILVCVLHGAMIFMSDLMREIPIELEYDFICVSSYQDGTSPGAVRLIKDLDRPIEGRDVLIVEDIIDTGYTLHYLKRTLAARNPASLRFCTLIDKVIRREIPVEIDYVGFVLNQDEFIVGYGMDYAGLYRNLPYIGVLKEAHL
jgi:hypoxanthine phosphoribosyltransferase